MCCFPNVLIYHKNWDTRKNCCNYPKIVTISFYYRLIGPKDADRMANSVDPDQTAPGFTLFAQIFLSNNLGSLRKKQYCGRKRKYKWAREQQNLQNQMTMCIQQRLRSGGLVMQSDQSLCSVYIWVAKDPKLFHLTFICPVDFSIPIDWMSPFPILGVSGVLFHF